MGSDEIWVVPTEDEVAVARLMAERRRATGRANETRIAYNQRAGDAQLLQNDFEGVLAEMMVCRWLGLAWTGCGRGNGSRPAKDVADLVQVRSVHDDWRGLLAREKDDDDPCVLVYVRSTDNHCRLWGWEFLGQVKRRGRLYERDTEMPYWVLPATRLKPMSELVELLDEIKSGQMLKD